MNLKWQNATSCAYTRFLLTRLRAKAGRRGADGALGCGILKSVQSLLAAVSPPNVQLFGSRLV